MKPPSASERNAALLAQIPLRERKLAQTRLALLDALLSALEAEPLADIRAKDLAARVGVSEATFFNHFSGKSDLLLYFVLHWSVEVGFAARVFDEDASGLEAIERVFAITAESVAKHPRVLVEIVAQQAVVGAPHEAPALAAADRLLRWPGIDGVADVPAQGLDSIVPRCLARAVARGELPAHTDVNLLFLAVASVFLGTPAALGPALRPDIGALWQAQLSLLWAGARAAPAPESPLIHQTKPKRSRASK
jgi:AcrR family transcriptional regulator